MTPSTSDRIERFLRETSAPTPFVIIDLDIVRSRYRSLRELLPEASIYYAVKANPAAAVISALAEQGASFDLASAGEIDRCLELGVPAARCSFGNTIKKEEDIARAAREGIAILPPDVAAAVCSLRKRWRSFGSVV